jgi:hypothetical protein
LLSKYVVLFFVAAGCLLAMIVAHDWGGGEKGVCPIFAHAEIGLWNTVEEAKQTRINPK